MTSSTNEAGSTNYTKVLVRQQPVLLKQTFLLTYLYLNAMLSNNEVTMILSNDPYLTIRQTP